MHIAVSLSPSCCLPLSLPPTQNSLCLFLFVVSSFIFYAVWQHCFAARTLFAPCPCPRPMCATRSGVEFFRQLLPLGNPQKYGGKKQQILPRNCFGFVCATFWANPLLLLLMLLLLVLLLRQQSQKY